MIQLIGPITEKTVKEVENQLSTIDGVVDVVIDSAGGDLFAGLAIYDMFSDREMNIHVKRAGSVASVIALSGKNAPTVEEGGGFAIHNAHVENTKGNHNDLRRVADSLEKYSQIVARIYQQKTKLSNAQAVSLMNDSTMIDSSDSITLGFASKVVERMALVENNQEIISQIFNIDMKLIDRVKNNLGIATAETPPAETPAEPTNQEGVEAPPQEGGFTEAQLVQITELVKATVAEALADAPTPEEIGNTIAVVLNDVVSQGTPPQAPEIVENALPVEKTAQQAFREKMNEIKNKNNG